MTLYTKDPQNNALSPASDTEILAAAKVIVKRVVPPPKNPTEMIKRAVQDRTLIKALTFVAALENDRAVKQAKEAERTGESVATHGCWDTCFEVLFKGVIEHYSPELPLAKATRLLDICWGWWAEADKIERQREDAHPSPTNVFRAELHDMLREHATRVRDEVTHNYPVGSTGETVIRLAEACELQCDHLVVEGDRDSRCQRPANHVGLHIEPRLLWHPGPPNEWPQPTGGLVDPPPPFEKPPHWGKPTMIKWLRQSAETSRKPHGYWELEALRLDCAADHINLLSEKVDQLHRQLGHALHAVTAAQNGLSNLQEGKFPLDDIPIMLDRVRELEKLALKDNPNG